MQGQKHYPKTKHEILNQKELPHRAGFPPFARALQRVINIPVLSWGTLMDFAYMVTVHRDYYGNV